MFQFQDWLEELYAQCTPFDASTLRQSPEYAEISQTLRAARQLLERHAPDSMADIDAFLDTYLELVDLECRHYFTEGYVLGEQAQLTEKHLHILHRQAVLEGQIYPKANDLGQIGRTLVNVPGRDHQTRAHAAQGLRLQVSLSRLRQHIGAQGGHVHHGGHTQGNHGHP